MQAFDRGVLNVLTLEGSALVVLTAEWTALISNVTSFGELAAFFSSKYIKRLRNLYAYFSWHQRRTLVYAIYETKDRISNTTLFC